MGCTTSKEKDEPYDSRQMSKTPLAPASAVTADGAAANGQVLEGTAGEEQGGGVATEDQGQGQVAIGEGKGDKQPAATGEVTTDDVIVANGEAGQASPEERAAVEVEEPIVEEAPVVPVQAIRVTEMPRLVIEDFTPYENLGQVNATHSEVEEESVCAEKSVADESCSSARAVADDVIDDQSQKLATNEMPAEDAAAVEEERVTPTVRANRSDEKVRVLNDLSSNDLPLYCHEEPVTSLQNLRFKELPQVVQDHFKESADELSTTVPLHRSRVSTPDVEASISPDDVALTAEVPAEPGLGEATVEEEEITPLVRQRLLPVESDENSKSNCAQESPLHGDQPTASAEDNNQDVQLTGSEATADSAAGPSHSVNVNGNGVLRDEDLSNQLEPQAPLGAVEQSTHKDTVDSNQSSNIDTTAVSDSA